MKARIRKTGEIVDVICYGGNPHKRSTVLDYVNYIDSQGVEHTESNNLNIYWDFELIDEHWQDVMERAAIAAMQGALANCYLHSVSNCAPCSSIARQSVLYADALIEELKKK